MIIGQMFGPNLFLITSNSGILLYMVSMTRALYEIRHDIRQAGDLGNFLIALECARSEKTREDNSSSLRVIDSATKVSNSSDVTSSQATCQSVCDNKKPTPRTPSPANDELGESKTPQTSSIEQKHVV